MKTKKHIFTQEQDNFIKSNFNKYSTNELLSKFNNKFNTNITWSSIRSRKNKIGAVNKINVKPVISISKEEQAYLLGNYKYKTIQELTNLFNKRFNKELSTTQIQHLKKKLGITNGRGNCQKPLLSERTDSEGYILLKVRDKQHKGYDKNYILKSHYIWEKQYGKIPKGYNLIYLDGNKKNCYIENLALVKNSELVYINHNMKLSKYKDINETSIMIAKMMAKIKEKRQEIL